MDADVLYVDTASNLALTYRECSNKIIAPVPKPLFGKNPYAYHITPDKPH